MKPQRLTDARKRLNDVRQEMVRAIVDALPTTDDKLLVKVAAIFWPEPKVAAPQGKRGVQAKLRKDKSKRGINPMGVSASEAARNAAEGRRAVAGGERPPLKDAMVIVMGNVNMSAQGVVDALARKKWLPSSSDHRQYISFMLSNNCPDTFERTETRGYYRVANGVLQKTKAEFEKVQADRNLKEHWGIPSTPPPTPVQVDANIVWAAIKKGGWTTVTVSQLAKHLKCKAPRLASPLAKLQRMGRVVKVASETGKKDNIYRVIIREPKAPKA